MSTVLEKITIKGVEIPLIYEQDSNLPIANIQVVFQHSGSIDDGKKAGLATMSSKLLNDGTKKLGGVGFAKKLEQKAIHITANSGRETFVFDAGSLTETFPKTIKYLRELLDDPNFTKKSFEKAQTMMQGTLASKENDFDYIANKNLSALLFPDTPLASPSLGTAKSIQKMKLDDIKNFFKKHIVLSGAIVVVGGDLSLDEAKTYAKEVLSGLKKGESQPLNYYQASNKETIQSIKKETKQAYIYFGSPYDLRVNDHDAYKSKVATFILGSGGFGSRLMEEVRVKRGLAYSAYCRVNLAKSSSYFMGYLQTKLESADEAKKIVKAVIAEFVEKGVSEEELTKAKQFLLGSEPLRVETLSQRLGRAFMEHYKGVGLGSSKNELKKIEALTLQDINHYIKQHSEINRLSFSIVTDK
jgi:predicted Zn-dependent peptidase